MTIQISTAVPLQNTPVSINIPSEKIPQGNLQLRSKENEATTPAQVSNSGIHALLTLPTGTTQFELESATAPQSAVQVIEGDEKLDIVLPDGLFGTYHFEKTAPRPYIWPLYGPGGVELTRAFPMENREGEKHDHPHHRSLWTAFDEVNEVNNWHEGEGHGWTRHQRFLDITSGAVFGGFKAESLWTNAKGEPFLSEVRSVRVYNVDGEARLFDYNINWNATQGDVNFGDTKEAGVIAVRVATSMDGERGGMISNSQGGRGEKECWGKRAAWCDYSGEVNGETYGITIFNHPKSDGDEPRWHVRDYGLFAANPFSVAAFEGGEKQPFVLEKGRSMAFPYRVLLHKGDAEAANVKSIWAAMETSPRVDVEI